MKKRIIAICSKADDLERHAARLKHAGYLTEVRELKGGAGLGAIWKNPPDVFVIDLSRAPATGRDVAIFLRNRKATRHVPLIFVEGEEDKVAAARRLLPDAHYTRWSGMEGTLRRALAETPSKPAVPPVLAGYSGTPLPKKLGIKAGTRVALLGAPPRFDRTLGALPEGARLLRRVSGAPEVIVLFSRSRKELERRFPSAARGLAAGGRLWLSWPKKTSGVKTDLTEPVVRRFGLEREFVDYKIAAIDDTWSGLCFARRKG